MKKISSLCLAAALFAAFAVPVVSVAQDAEKAEDQTYALKRIPKKGEAAKYKISIEITEEGDTLTLSNIQDEKILSVEKDGTYEVEETVSEMKMKYKDEEVDMDEEGDEKPKPSISIYDARNILVEVKDEEEDEDEDVFRRANSLAFVAPEKAVKVGDEWTYEFKEDEDKGVVAAKSSYKVESFEKVGERQTMKVKLEFKETDGDEPMSSEATLWIDVKDGNLVKMDGTFKNMVFPMSPPLEGKITITRED